MCVGGYAWGMCVGVRVEVCVGYAWGTCMGVWGGVWGKGVRVCAGVFLFLFCMFI